jgi:hypothetical protein
VAHEGLKSLRVDPGADSRRREAVARLGEADESEVGAIHARRTLPRSVCGNQRVMLMAAGDQELCAVIGEDPAIEQGPQKRLGDRRRPDPCPGSSERRKRERRKRGMAAPG